MIEFGSVCSGIEAASVAWHPLGWKAAWLAEIEPFPSAVLAHHYPSTPNLGDMTLLPDMLDEGLVAAPPLFCGGTPCQAFSVAGLRKSLDDARGNLSLTFCEIANAIDNSRARSGKQPCIVFWENVPGVLSTKDNAFGCFLAGLAGEEQPLEPAGGKWSNAGVVLGPQRTVAWRVLDAQYFGVAQRRRRVFVVASARDGFDPVEVLFEFEGVRRDSAPSREAGQEVTPTIRAGAPNGGAGHGARSGDSKDDLIVPHLAKCLTTGTGKRFDTETETLPVTHSLRGEGFDASEDGTGRGTPLVPVAFHHDAQACQLPTEGRDTRISESLTCSQQAAVAYGIRTANTSANGHGIAEEVAHTLDRAQGQAVAQPYTLAIRGRGDSHNLEYRQDGTANALLTPNGGRGGIGVGAIAAPAIGWSEELTASCELAGTLQRGGDGGRHDGVMTPAMQVRRLTPTECERLQGFPDGYTNIPVKVKSLDPPGSGPCAKQVVTATVVSLKGQHFVATNHCMTPQPTCARAGMPTGEGYELCKSACGQTAHAEVNAIKLAGVAAQGGTLYIEGHTYGCDDCIAMAREAGITNVVIGKPPGNAPDGPRYKALGNSWAVPNVRWIGRRIYGNLFGGIVE